MKYYICIFFIFLSIVLDVVFIILIRELPEKYPSLSKPRSSYVNPEPFNNQFEGYRGEQRGAQVSALIGILISNAKTYMDDSEKVPSVYFDKVANRIDSPTDCLISYNYDYESDKDSQPFYDEYIEKLAEIKKNYIEDKHIYYIYFDYSDIGYISQINVLYERSSLDE